jgi:hypothetical protein
MFDKGCSTPISLSSSRKVIKRDLKNNEEKHIFFFNLLFCFFCNYACRIKQVIDEDIYIVSKDTQCEVCYEKAKKVWIKRYEKYLKELDKYKHIKLTNPLFFLYICI